MLLVLRRRRKLDLKLEVICRENLWILQICTSMCLVATSSVRLLAAFANEHDLELCRFDVDQTFVRADLNLSLIHI